VHLRYPIRHRRRWRSTNPLERSLAEVKRRTKVIGRFPGETSCLTLVWAVLDLYITHAKNGVRFSQLDRQRLKRIRYEDSDQPIPEEVSAGYTDHHREPQPTANLQQQRDATVLGLETPARRSEGRLGVGPVCSDRAHLPARTNGLLRGLQNVHCSTCAEFACKLRQCRSSCSRWSRPVLRQSSGNQTLR
jgi:hypothetical protein